jgi:hypothetical protein
MGINNCFEKRNALKAEDILSTQRVNLFILVIKALRVIKKSCYYNFYIPIGVVVFCSIKLRLFKIDFKAMSFIFKRIGGMKIIQFTDGFNDCQS